MPYAWQDWAVESRFGERRYQSLEQPESNKQPSVLTTAVVRIPGHDWTDLPAPTAFEGPVLLDEARAAVACVVGHINSEGAPMVATLLGNDA